MRLSGNKDSGYSAALLLGCPNQNSTTSIKGTLSSASQSKILKRLTTNKRLGKMLSKVFNKPQLPKYLSLLFWVAKALSGLKYFASLMEIQMNWLNKSKIHSSTQLIDYIFIYIIS